MSVATMLDRRRPTTVTTPVVTVETITPELAAKLLAQNSRNRNVRDSKVDQFARDMLAGRWGFDVCAIAFDQNGVLLNGQHRLGGVVRSGTSQRFIVVRDLPADAQRNMDRGTKRTFGDDLRIDGRKRAPLVASVTRMALLWQHRSIVHNNRALSDEELHQFFEANMSLLVTASQVADYVRTVIPVAPTPLGATYFRCARVDPEAAASFFGSLANGSGLAEGNPILTLRNRLIRIANDKSQRLHGAEVAALVVTAWNAWRAGESRSRIQLPKSGLSESTFPEVL